MKKIFALLLAVALTSCNQQSSTGKDGYTFGEKQYTQNPVTVNIITYQSQKEIYEVAKSKGADYPEVVAFSVLTVNRDTCTIHMIDPAVKYEPEYVGHEFLHCVYGQWHKDNNTF